VPPPRLGTMSYPPPPTHPATYPPQSYPYYPPGQPPLAHPHVPPPYAPYGAWGAAAGRPEAQAPAAHPYPYSLDSFRGYGSATTAAPPPGALPPEALPLDPGVTYPPPVSPAVGDTTAAVTPYPGYPPRNYLNLPPPIATNNAQAPIIQ